MPKFWAIPLLNTSYFFWDFKSAQNSCFFLIFKNRSWSSKRRWPEKQCFKHYWPQKKCLKHCFSRRGRLAKIALQFSGMGKVLQKKIFWRSSVSFGLRTFLVNVETDPKFLERSLFPKTLFLKSFDFQISGKERGWHFKKITILFTKK